MNFFTLHTRHEADLVVIVSAVFIFLAHAMDRYLYVEWEDPSFGARAAAVHKRLQEALAAEGGRGASALAAVSVQMGMMAQLRHIVHELKARELQAITSVFTIYCNYSTHTTDSFQSLHNCPAPLILWFVLNCFERNGWCCMDR